MANNTMLIDASHPEETRVVVVRGNRVEEFDFESAQRKQLRGNIYLAKVTRVEPSLQAAFIEYGGNRHGFLAFSEIHPDYYQIPVADREALLAEEARSAARGDDEDEEGESRRKRRPRTRRGAKAARRRDEETVSADAEQSENGEEAATETSEDEASQITSSSEEVETMAEAGETQESAAHEATDEDAEDADEDEESQADEEDHVEQIGGGDALEDIGERSYRPRRQYKIQEVIKRRQVLLVQVVKEERGTKGAALTTYLSLAGRYSVLMPNTARGGGISRKITSAEDRKRLKSMAQDLEVPEGMGVILRTAGASRTKPEIKRDFEYLLRVWENVRELTLNSTAPSLVYEEGSLVKRAIRDLYSKDIEEVHVSGEEGYREAKDFMRMLMPSHAKAVKPFREPQPLFARFGVEAQLDAMFNNVVTLRSGGYIVINQTEALVAIDVNSGRSTREHNIEDTALKTNLEAADEVARQLRLRDLAGLIVIDFIDMEEGRNNKAVERKVKEALKNDRARIQVGRISHFGLLEMSRQRIRTGVLESSTSPCPHCNGTGMLRSTPSLALHLVRAIEDQLLRNAAYNIIIRTRTEVAFYVLNHKRPHLRALEERFGVIITIMADDHLTGGQAFTLERGEPALGPAPGAAKAYAAPVIVEEEEEEYEEEIVEDETSDEEADTPRDSERSHEARDSDDRGGRRRKRRRRRRGGRGGEREENGGPRFETDRNTGEESGSAESDEDDDGEETSGEVSADESSSEAEGRRRRRRGRRGGRRNRVEGDREDADTSGPDEEAGEVVSPPPAIAIEETEVPVAVEEPIAEKPKRSRKKAAAAENSDVEVTEPVKPARGRRKKVAEPEVVVVEPAEVSEAVATVPEPRPEAVPAKTPEPEITTPLIEVSDPNKPKRSGWWARAKQVIGGE